MNVTTISDIKGLTPQVKAKLESEGIKNTMQLLEHTQTQKQLTELASKVSTTPEAMKELANRADLMRLHGVGGDFSNLLEEAGVNSCKELQHRVPEKLHTMLVEIHTSRKIGHHAPSLAQITEWITEAKKLAATSPA
jgi:predicted RecB family nuclease